MPPIRQTSYRRTPSGRSGRPTQSSRLEVVRTGINQLFSGRSTLRPSNPSRNGSKSPRFVLALPDLSSTRLNVPYLTRASPSASRSNSQHSDSSSNSTAFQPNESPSTPIISRPTTPNSFRQQIQLPDASAVPHRVRRESARRVVGVDPAEQLLADLAQAGRERRRHYKKRKGCSCGPKLKNKKIRMKVLHCFIAGLFLALILTIYLALALSNRNESQEFHVLLIIIILTTTIFFCHSVIRLCIMLLHPPAEHDVEQQLPSMICPGGYANPEVPIRVALARDEEAAGIESEATKLPPPAYGLWRESVRVDPNRIFWQRNEAASWERQNSVHRFESHLSTANRPPSYISEDGIEYVMEAAPRSIARTTDVHLPPHPSDRGPAWSI